MRLAKSILWSVLVLLGGCAPSGPAWSVKVPEVFSATHVQMERVGDRKVRVTYKHYAWMVMKPVGRTSEQVNQLMLSEPKSGALVAATVYDSTEFPPEAKANQLAYALTGPGTEVSPVAVSAADGSASFTWRSSESGEDLRGKVICRPLVGRWDRSLLITGKWPAKWDKPVAGEFEQIAASIDWK